LSNSYGGCHVPSELLLLCVCDPLWHAAVLQGAAVLGTMQGLLPMVSADDASGA
jgi:hypothetical protein